MSNFTFLTEEQVFGDEQLDVLKKYGTKCAITDFSILLGGCVLDENRTDYDASEYCVSDGNSKKDRAGLWWLRTLHKGMIGYGVCCVSLFGHKKMLYDNWRDVGARPSLPYSSISSVCSNKVRGRNGILEVEYGEYPQTVVSEELAKTLESAYLNRTIKKPGKSYTTDSTFDTYTSFESMSHIEYEYNRKKYIRFEVDSINTGRVLSDGSEIQSGDVYWIEVEPIKWLVDERTNIALSKKILFSGIKFMWKKYSEGYFDMTFIKEFMDNHFSKDIIPSVKKKIQKKNMTKGDKITEILCEIEKYLLPNNNKDEVLKEIDELVEEYNKNIDKLGPKELIDNDIYPSLDSMESEYMNLSVKLHVILDTVKKSYVEEKHYYDILELLDEIIGLFNGSKIYTPENDIINIFRTIIYEVIPLIKINNNLETNILNTLLEEKQRIEEIINNSEYDRYKSFDDWEIDFRKKIERILTDILDVNNQQDRVTFIIQYLSNNLPELSERYEDKIIALYLKEILEMIKELEKDAIDKQQLDSLRKIALINVDNISTFEETIEYLSEKISLLAAMQAEVLYKKEMKKKISGYKV